MVTVIHRLVPGLGPGHFKMIEQASFFRNSLQHNLAGCVSTAACDRAVTLSVLNSDLFVLISVIAAGLRDLLPAECGHRVAADILAEDFAA